MRFVQMPLEKTKRREGTYSVCSSVIESNVPKGRVDRSLSERFLRCRGRDKVKYVESQARGAAIIVRGHDIPIGSK